MADNENSDADVKAPARDGRGASARAAQPRKFQGRKGVPDVPEDVSADDTPATDTSSATAASPSDDAVTSQSANKKTERKNKRKAKPEAKEDLEQSNADMTTQEVDETPQPAVESEKETESSKPKADPKPRVVEIAPMAPRAYMRRRHYGLVLSFTLLVIAPLIISAWYLWTVSTDQYASTVGFTVRQEEGGSSSGILSVTAATVLGGGSTSSDTDILYEFIQSQEMVTRIDQKLNLRGHYSRSWPDDIVFALWPEASVEDMQWFWSRIVRVSYDQSSGLLELRVLAFEPEMAQAIGQEILKESQRMINALNEQARTDAIGYADQDLNAALDRLKAAREELILFRTRTQIVDPETDLQGRLGVVNNLQQQLAEALVGLDVLLDQSSESDPRIKQARRTIEVIRNRIAIERQNVASGDASVVGDDYPSLLAEYEGLIVDREFAEEGYRAALAALDLARTNAQRQSRYLAAYVQPTLPQTAEFPRRMVLMGLIGLFVLLIWSILVLIYYSIRDSR